MTDEQQAAFDEGYEHARAGKSDFARRFYRALDEGGNLTGLREAYMRGRSAYHADRILNRVRP
jgi:hypothetical protein